MQLLVFYYSSVDRGFGSKMTQKTLTQYVS